MRNSRFKYFHNPDHAEQFLDGAMFCWNAAYYRDYEDAKAQQIVGDEYEGIRLVTVQVVSPSEGAEKGQGSVCDGSVPHR